jgi:hypothetical protein
MKEEKKEKCPSCGKLKPANEVYERECAYQNEINDCVYLETICDDCEDEHRGDI